MPADPTIPELVARLRELHNARRYPTETLATTIRDDQSAQVYATSIGPMRAVRPVAETTVDYADLIAETLNALPAILDALERQGSHLESARCAHQRPALCVSWDYPMITIDGTEFQISGWCCECGALRVFATDNLDEERWLLPRQDCLQATARRARWSRSGAGEAYSSTPPGRDSGKRARCPCPAQIVIATADSRSRSARSSGVTSRARGPGSTSSECLTTTCCAGPMRARSRGASPPTGSVEGAAGPPAAITHRSRPASRSAQHSSAAALRRRSRKR